MKRGGKAVKAKNEKKGTERLYSKNQVGSFIQCPGKRLGEGKRMLGCG